MDKDGFWEALAEEFGSRMAASLEMLCGEAVKLERYSGESREEVIWQKYALNSTPACSLFGGTSNVIARAIGARVLAAAGLEEISDEDVEGSYLEVMQSAMSAIAQSIGRHTGQDVSVTHSPGTNTPQGSDLEAVYTLHVGDQRLFPILLRVSPELKQLRRNTVNEVPPATGETAAHTESVSSRAPEHSNASDRDLDRILDLELPLRVSFGKASIPLKEVLKLTTGSIVELDRSILDPVEIIVNSRIVGRGEVVVVDGNYGVRIQEISGFAGPNQ